MASTTNPSVDLDEEQETQPVESSGELMDENLHSSPNDSAGTAVEQMSTDLTIQDNLNDSMSMIDDMSMLLSSSVMIHPTEMITADENSSDFSSSGPTHSSVARIHVKQGQIFRVQINNQVKEIRGNFNL